MPVMIFDNDTERNSFEEWFVSVDKKFIEEMREKIKPNAIMQHILAKEKWKTRNGCRGCCTFIWVVQNME